ncbi:MULTISPECIES: cytochrome c biogenesis protein CcsA [unclassified Oceanispirochaeta]|uniref:cytochrome c biogenesis protein CcsA n=1 Tax=unclassified Oceanispirochaeta TaxID=2635722 RepID=UPI000E093518|nr:MULTISPECIES: cytochrome c biogenesis protein CcsA [unclassified Oceanispirochaeta]MBF9016855.1 cytochrome c biogenesis protein CcsA [Oceanispirochaeta sp. M2]NPD73218.1 cytochrome c biogenesis protein CcsA [Oceanispirochaeta sp. M1]RDG31085.1 cytochrome C biogenesis protein [Oceanispirochaeta sp. M1]
MILSLVTYIWAGLSVLLQVISFFADSLRKRLLVPVLNLSASVLLLIVLIYRSVKINYVALTGTFESLLFYAFCIFLISGFYGLQKKVKVIQVIQFFATITALALLLVASSPLVSKDLNPPVPALQSAWLILHVAFSFIGEAFFAFSFITALMALFSKDEEKMKEYDVLTYRAIIVGYPVFTIGALLFGAIWAEAAWGAFWTWDPKETWALITWLFYSLYLHFRLFAKKGVRLCSWIAVIGFLSTLFTFFGVNYLLSGLHSYR